MEHYLSLFVRAVFIETWPGVVLGHVHLPRRLKKISAAFGLGVAVIVVLTITVPVNNLIYKICCRRCLGMGGLSDLDLSFLKLLAYIGVIAAMVQILEMFLIVCTCSVFRLWVFFCRSSR